VAATLFDGEKTSPCPESSVLGAISSLTVAWIDVALDDPSDASSDSLLTAIGIDPSAVRRELDSDLGFRFTVRSDSLEGAAWADDNDGTPASPIYLHWNSTRLVTVRIGKAAAVAGVQSQLTQRWAVLRDDPSRLPGLVLDLLSVTVQRGLMNIGVRIGTLDMDVISTPVPRPDHAAELARLRKIAQPIALRYPLYRVNAQSGLVDLSGVSGLSTGGVGELQKFSSAIDGTWQTLQGVIEQLRNAAQDIQGQVTAWQGNRINALTVVTMIFLPISFLTGYFGMNFAWLDDQLESFGSWVAFGVVLPVASVIIAAVLLARGGFALDPRRWRSRRRRPPVRT